MSEYKVPYIHRSICRNVALKKPLIWINFSWTRSKPCNCPNIFIMTQKEIDTEEIWKTFQVFLDYFELGDITKAFSLAHPCTLELPCGIPDEDANAVKRSRLGAFSGLFISSGDYCEIKWSGGVFQNVGRKKGSDLEPDTQWGSL